MDCCDDISHESHINETLAWVFCDGSSQKDARQSVKHKGSFRRRWCSAGGSLRSAVWMLGGGELRAD